MDQDWDYNQASLDEAAARLERLQAAAGRPDRAAAGSGAVAAVRAALASDLDVPAALRRGIFEIAVDSKTVGSIKLPNRVQTPLEPGRHTLQIGQAATPTDAAPSRWPTESCQLPL